jgi:hypothetical protein
LNLDAIASIRFAGGADEFSATVNFLSVPVTDTQGASFVSETFGGEAARNLLNLLGAAPKQSTGPEDDRPSYDDQPIPSPFVIGVGRKKAWYYHRGADGRCYFLAFVNAKGSCSMRTFDAETGRFLGKKYPEGGGAYQDKFASLIENAKELRVSSQTNWGRDCRDRLPKSALDDLSEQLS